MIAHNVVSVSGGKDSTALLLLAIERKAENLQAVFADTGHEHRQTYEYVEYLDREVHPIRVVKADFTEELARKRERLRAIAAGEISDPFGKFRWTPERAAKAIELLHPTGNPFLDLVLLKGFFPTTKSRFCSEELKRNPLIEQVSMPIMQAGQNVISWQGVRADESPSRALLAEMEYAGTDPESGGELWNYRPILQWTAAQCFDMHRRHGVRHNPLYEQGMKRVGCMPCIHAGKDELLEISRRFPEELERVAEWERIVSRITKHENQTTSFFHKSDGRGENIYQAIQWAKTSRGGKQIDLVRAEGSGPACSSIYGLCE